MEGVRKRGVKRRRGGDGDRKEGVWRLGSKDEDGTRGREGEENEVDRRTRRKGEDTGGGER